MSTITTRNFSLLNVKTITLSVTNVTQTVLLPATGGDDIVLVNDTATVIFVRTGDSGVVADLEAMPILAGEKGAYSIGRMQEGVTHIAAVTAVTSVDLIVARGTGN